VEIQEFSTLNVEAGGKFHKNSEKSAYGGKIHVFLNVIHPSLGTGGRFH
jgi:hypothetical protein